MQYQSSDVEVIVQDIRYSLSDKIANFGGVFGIWAEFTGFSLLGIINVFLIVFKLLLGRLMNWNSNYMSKSNERSAIKHNHSQDPSSRKTQSTALEEVPKPALTQSPDLAEDLGPEQVKSPTIEEELENVGILTTVHCKIPRPIKTQSPTFIEELKPEPDLSPLDRLRPKNPTSVTHSTSKTPPPFFF